MKRFAIVYNLSLCGILNAFDIIPASKPLDIGITDNGIHCETPCGQDGMFEGRPWCHTFDSWDFCDRNDRKSKGVSTNGLIVRQNHVGSRKQTLLEKVLQRFKKFSSSIDRQDTQAVGAAGVGVLALTLAAAGVSILQSTQVQPAAPITPITTTTPAPTPAPKPICSGDNKIATLDASCSNQGSCDNKACTCSVGFGGTNCETPPTQCDTSSPTACGFASITGLNTPAHGYCRVLSGTNTAFCSCNRGRSGSNCDDRCPKSTGTGTGCCSSSNLCAFGEGMCTSNADCQGNLICNSASNSCVCPAGWQSNTQTLIDDKQQRCVKCEPGSISDGNVDNMGCTVCSQFANVQQTACIAKCENSRALDTPTQCKWCAPGHGLKDPSTPGGDCETCPASTTLTAVDGITCLKTCPAGQALKDALTSRCVSACPPGFVMKGNPATCTDCNTENANLAGTTCVKVCPFGQVLGKSTILTTNDAGTALRTCI